MHDPQAYMINMTTFTFVSILSMVNPIGMSPVFIEKTRGIERNIRNNLSYKVSIYGAILLISTIFFGPYLLQFFGVSLPDIQVAGGLFVFYTAWQMLITPAGASHDDDSTAPVNDSNDIAFFPLTMPITAGAGSIAVSLSISSKILHSGSDVVSGYAGSVIGICLVFAVVAICYRFSDALFSCIGRAGTGAISRLTAFLLLAIGVEVTWGGLKPLLLTLHS